MVYGLYCLSFLCAQYVMDNLYIDEGWLLSFVANNMIQLGYIYVLAPN